MPGITPWCASSRRQIRQSPNFLKTARGRPHLLQRVYSRTPNFFGRPALTISDFFATQPSRRPSAANGSPSAFRSARAGSSVSAVVVIATSTPRIWLMLS